jgi:CHAT domain-containing protein
MGVRARPRFSTLVIAAAVSLLAVTQQVRAQQHSVSFVAPPRTISDITAILDQEKPGPKVAAGLRAEADAEPKAGTAAGELAKFHYARCQARGRLGEFRKAVADCDKAVELGQRSLDQRTLSRLLQGLALQYQSAGEPKKALELYKRMLQPADQKGAGRGFNFTANRNIASIYISFGDLNQAEAYVRRNDALLADARTWKSYAGFRRGSWHSDVEFGHALLFEARGQFREAEAAYKRVEAFKREALPFHASYDGPRQPLDQVLQSIDLAIVNQGRMKARQGRIAEGESDLRRALLSRLKAAGKYNARTARYVGYLANNLMQQGRLAEAEQLIRTEIEINRTLGIAKDSGNVAHSLSQLASNLSLQRRWKEAAKVYAELDEAIAGWPPARKEGLSFDESKISTLYATNNLAAGIAAAERLIERQKSRHGQQSLQTAAARGMLAVGLARAGRDAEAATEFKLAIPILTTISLHTDLDDTTGAVVPHQRTMTTVVEAYIGLLARSGGPDAAAESFRLADLIRGRSVQNAVVASSVRGVAGNPALSDLARKNQDLDKQIAALLGTLNNSLALPPEERDAKALQALRTEIGKLQAQRDASKRDLAQRFPKYASLVDPQTPSLDDVRAALREDEAFLSFYFGRRASYVWVVRKAGPAAFATLRLTAGDVAAKVKRLRAAVEPQGEELTDIPPFDVVGAYELFAELLQPVEAAWRPASSLIVVTNGALGFLPLSLLPTEPSQAVAHNDPELFGGYRHVAWLARTHAVTMAPSAGSLRALRQLPPRPAKRDTMIGFGDPYFSKEQAAEAQSQMAALEISENSRSVRVRRRAAVQRVGVDRAALARLPRLADTGEELKAVALTLSADPTKVLHLGKDANEKIVKGTDLSKFRIIAFATHGLVPGDVDGLTQPALALTAPDVADIDGDGLLTMEEVLALRLNADWVVLSACNTGTGAGAGAEAVSGLGRAFFYAGARTLLVTNWPVYSASARDLVTDLFRRQASDAKLTRAEALRQAMVDLMEGPGFKGVDGATLYAYAHPVFWAPYSIIGDGGGGQP